MTHAAHSRRGHLRGEKRLLPCSVAKALVRNSTIFGQLSDCAREVPSGVPPIATFMPFRRPRIGTYAVGWRAATRAAPPARGFPRGFSPYSVERSMALEVIHGVRQRSLRRCRLLSCLPFASRTSVQLNRFHRRGYGYGHAFGPRRRPVCRDFDWLQCHRRFAIGRRIETWREYCHGHVRYRDEIPQSLWKAEGSKQKVEGGPNSKAGVLEKQVRATRFSAPAIALCLPPPAPKTRCHSERSEESCSALAPTGVRRTRARFLASLGMTELS